MFWLLFCFVCLVVVVDFFITSLKSPVKAKKKKKCDVPEAVVMNPRTFGWTTYRSSVIVRAMKFLLWLWRSAIRIIAAELSNHEIEGRAVLT